MPPLFFLLASLGSYGSSVLEKKWLVQPKEKKIISAIAVFQTFKLDRVLLPCHDNVLRASRIDFFPTCKFFFKATVLSYNLTLLTSPI